MLRGGALGLRALGPQLLAPLQQLVCWYWFCVPAGLGRAGATQANNSQTGVSSPVPAPGVEVQGPSNVVKLEEGYFTTQLQYLDSQDRYRYHTGSKTCRTKQVGTSSIHCRVHSVRFCMINTGWAAGKASELAYIIHAFTKGRVASSPPPPRSMILRAADIQSNMTAPDVLASVPSAPAPVNPKSGALHVPPLPGSSTSPSEALLCLM